MGESEEQRSKLDLKLAREKLLVAQMDHLWDTLEAAAQDTCTKLHGKCNGELSARLNDHNTVIRVARSEPLEHEASFVEHKLEIRLDREGCRVIAGITKRYSRSTKQETVGKPRSYAIEPDAEVKSLFFSGSGRHFSAVELAEHEIAEQFLKMEL